MLKNCSSTPWPCIEYLLKTNISIELVTSNSIYHLKQDMWYRKMDIEYKYKLSVEHGFNFYLTKSFYVFFTAVIRKVYDDAIHR